MEKRLDALFRDPRTPWGVNLSRKGSRIIGAWEWLRFAHEQLGDQITPSELEAATDAFVAGAGGEKTGEWHPLNGLRHLAGRRRKDEHLFYEMPAAFFGDEPFGIADQIRAAALRNAR